MRALNNSDWLVPIGLVTLSLVPVIAGSVRLIELSSNVEVTIDNARFIAAPLPVIIHIISATIFCILGAFQFSPAIRNHYLKWHRMSGRILLPCGVVSALSGLWMTQFHPVGALDGLGLYYMRWAVGLGMVFSLLYGLYAVLQRQINTHKAWLMRGYALGIGAGTQVFTFLIWLPFIDEMTVNDKTWFMGASWLVNIIVAEWFIRRKPKARSKKR